MREVASGTGGDKYGFVLEDSTTGTKLDGGVDSVRTGKDGRGKFDSRAVGAKTAHALVLFLRAAAAKHKCEKSVSRLHIGFSKFQTRSCGVKLVCLSEKPICLTGT